MTLIFEKYDLVKHLGTGSFGDVYVVRNIATNERLACKIELNTKIPTLKHEANMLQYFNKVDFIPKLRRFGSENGKLVYDNGFIWGLIRDYKNQAMDYLHTKMPC